MPSWLLVAPAMSVLIPAKRCAARALPLLSLIIFPPDIEASCAGDPSSRATSGIPTRFVIRLAPIKSKPCSTLRRRPMLASRLPTRRNIMRTMSEGLCHCCAPCLKAGCRRLVFSSTCAIYGEPAEIPIGETTPQNPVNPYGASKTMVERILRDYRAGPRNERHRSSIFQCQRSRSGVRTWRAARS